MKFDQQALQRAQRHAYDTLIREGMNVQTSAGSKFIPNPYRVKAENISISAQLIQEQAFVNTQNIFTFDFSQNAPPKTAVLNNVQLGANNVFVIYGLQLLLGEGASGNTRVYRSFGLTANDESIYNSTVSLKLEQSTLIDKMNGLEFKDFENSPSNFWNQAGMTLINPQRILTGRLGVFEIDITLLNSIAGIVLTANTFLSMRLHGALGQASATR